MLRWVIRLTDWICVAFLTALMLLTVCDVIGRYFLNRPVSGAYELTQICMALMVFSALPVLSARDGHISVELMSGVWRRLRLQRIMHVFVHLFTAAVMAYLAWQLWNQAELMQRVNLRTASLRLPLYPEVAFMSVMAGVTAVVLMLRAVLPPLPPANATLQMPG